MIRLALVGIAGYGGTLLAAIRKHSQQAGVRLVAAADIRLAQLKDQAAQLASEGVELFDDAMKMFQAMRGRCEAVYIGTGIPSHAALAVAAAKAGYHIHLEKPPAPTIQEMDQIIQALDEAGRFCLVGFQLAQCREAHFIKERIVAGRLGRIHTIAVCAGWPRTTGYYGRNPWAGKLRLGSAWVLDGPAMNALAHQVTEMLFYASPTPGRLAVPSAVRAELYVAGPVETHDTAAIEVRTADGPRCYFLASHCTEALFGPVVEVFGEKGRAVRTAGCATVHYSDGAAESCRAEADAGRGNMIANLAQAVLNNDGALLRCPLQQTRPMVLAVNGAYESSGSIHRIQDPKVRREGSGDKQRTVVDGLDNLLMTAAANRCLLSDLPGAPPWAAATKEYDLTGYKSFPQQFRP